MVKTIRRVGNSHGIVLGARLLELAQLKAGDEVNVEVHQGGTITITPIRRQPAPEQLSRVVRKVMKEYARTMKKLS